MSTMPLQNSPIPRTKYQSMSKSQIKNLKSLPHVVLAVLVIAGAIFSAGGCKSGSSAPASLWGVASSGNPREAAPTPKLQDPTPAQRTNVQISLAESFERRGDFEAAIKIYEAVVKRHPHNGRIYHRLAVLNDKEAQYDESAKYYPLAIKHGADPNEVQCDFAYSLYLQNHWRESEQRLHAILGTQPTMARAHANLALILARTGRVNEAVVAFERSGCSPALARVNLAHVYIWDGSYVMARQELQLAQRMQPGMDEVAMALDALEGREAGSGTPPSQISSLPPQPTF